MKSLPKKIRPSLKPCKSVNMYAMVKAFDRKIALYIEMSRAKFDSFLSNIV